MLLKSKREIEMTTYENTTPYHSKLNKNKNMIEIFWMLFFCIYDHIIIKREAFKTISQYISTQHHFPPSHMKQVK